MHGEVKAAHGGGLPPSPDAHSRCSSCSSKTHEDKKAGDTFWVKHTSPGETQCYQEGRQSCLPLSTMPQQHRSLQCARIGHRFLLEGAEVGATAPVQGDASTEAVAEDGPPAAQAACRALPAWCGFGAAP